MFDDVCIGVDIKHVFNGISTRHCPEDTHDFEAAYQKLFLYMQNMTILQDGPVFLTSSFKH